MFFIPHYGVPLPETLRQGYTLVNLPQGRSQETNRDRIQAPETNLIGVEKDVLMMKVILVAAASIISVTAFLKGGWNRHMTRLVQVIGITASCGAIYGVSAALVDYCRCREWFTVDHKDRGGLPRFRLVTSLDPKVNALAWGVVNTCHVCLGVGFWLGTITILHKKPGFGRLRYLSPLGVANCLAPWVIIAGVTRCVFQTQHVKALERKAYIDIGVNGPVENGLGWGYCDVGKSFDQVAAQVISCIVIMQIVAMKMRLIKPNGSMRSLVRTSIIGACVDVVKCVSLSEDPWSFDRVFKILKGDFSGIKPLKGSKQDMWFQFQAVVEKVCNGTSCSVSRVGKVINQIAKDMLVTLKGWEQSDSTKKEDFEEYLSEKRGGVDMYSFCFTLFLVVPGPKKKDGHYWIDVSTPQNRGDIPERRMRVSPLVDYNYHTAQDGGYLEKMRQQGERGAEFRFDGKNYIRPDGVKMGVEDLDELRDFIQGITAERFQEVTEWIEERWKEFCRNS